MKINFLQNIMISQ